MAGCMVKSSDGRYPSLRVSLSRFARRRSSPAPDRRAIAVAGQDIDPSAADPGVMKRFLRIAGAAQRIADIEVGEGRKLAS